MSVRHDLTLAVFTTMTEMLDDNPSTLVTFGPDEANEIGNYLMVGVDDPFATTADAGSASEEHGTAHLDTLDVDGSITLVIFCWSGEDLITASADAGVIEDALRQGMWDDVHWGVPGVERTELSDSRTSVTVDSEGASVLLTITLSYSAHLRDPRTYS